MKKYKVILADPPWEYGDKMKGHSFSLDHEYKTMKLEDIMNIDVASLADKDCALFLWATSPNLPMAMEVIKAWGFKFKTIAFVWNKITVNGNQVYNLGRWTMGSVEIVLLATKGSPKRIKKNIKQLIIAERGRHSEKPDEVAHRIVELMGDVPRLEMFARKQLPGWDVFGDEVENSIDLNDVPPL